MHALLLDLPPNPLALARKLSHLPGLALLHAAADGLLPRRSYLAASPVEMSDALLPTVELVSTKDSRYSAPRWMGAIPYEAGRSIEAAVDNRPEPSMMRPRWMRYAATAVIDHDAGTLLVIGDDRLAVRELAEALRKPPKAPGPLHIERLPSDEPEGAHLARIEEAQRAIFRGELHLVNLARRLRYRLSGELIDIYDKLHRAALPPFGAALDMGDTRIVATSPELFLSISPERRIRLAPIKGTRPRGLDAESDNRLRRELESDPKEREELDMVIREERARLEKLASSVTLARAPYVHTHPTLHHRLALLEGRLRDGSQIADIVSELFPSASVTGVPKEKAMRWISRLEPHRRGLYTGAFGMVGHDGSVRLAMAIRTLTITNGEAEYLTGGGIVKDSDPMQELAETEWKAAQLLRLF